MEENKEQQNENSENLKVLRTYTSDMAQVIRDNEISAIKIAMAEKEKREENLLYRKAEGTSLSKILLMVGGIILIIVGILGSYFLLNKNKKIEIVPLATTNAETFISYDASSYIDVTNINDAIDLSLLINKEKLSDIKKIEALFLTKKINEVTNIINSNDFLFLINSTAPDSLVRSLSSDYLLGEYSDVNNSENKNSMFLVFETTNYSQAYASMLSWEKTMLNDLSVLFNINIENTNVVEKQWKDLIINNKDIRVLYGENGEEILCYVFVNKNIFIITNNTNTIKEVLSRVLAKNN